MSRRLAILLAVLAVLLGLAVTPWSIASPRLKEQVSRELRETYGLELVASGQTTLALLPVPRLKFTGVSLANGTGQVLIEGAQLRGELRLLPLIAARIVLNDLAVVHGTVQLALAADGTTSWDAVLAKAKASLAAHGHSRLRRLLVLRSRFLIEDQPRQRTVAIEGANLVARWPSGTSALEVTASASWKGDPVTATLSGLFPADLVASRRSPVDLHVSSRHGEVHFAGTLATDEPRLDGEITASTPSFNDLLGWTGLARPLPGLAQAVNVSGGFSLSPSELALPRTALTSGNDRLDGAVSVRFDADRAAVRATLAGESLDLSPMLVPQPDAWNAAIRDVSALRQADIDLRLSASTVSLGAGELHDVAASLLTSADRVELSLGRAGFKSGLVRARVALVCIGESYEARLQSSFSRLEAADLLAMLGQPRVMTGQARGQVTLEMAGTSFADMLRSLGGRIEMAVDNGELPGVSLAGQTAAGSRTTTSESRRTGPRTPFQRFALNLNVANGLAEMSEGVIEATNLHADVTGRVSFIDRTVSLTARAGPPGETDPAASITTITIAGPWTSPAAAPIGSASPGAR